MRTYSEKQDIVILGAGITGLTAAFFAQRYGKNLLLVEKDTNVGGLAKTVRHGRFRFDLGGHRFVTKHKKLYRFITTLLNEQYYIVQRSSKIYLNQRYISYPLEPINALLQTGGLQALSIIFDYLKQQFKPRKKNCNTVSLEDWVVSHFGRKLYLLFFKDYSEKVWGIDCTKIDKDWINERIQGLSLSKALKQALFSSQSQQYQTLTDQFLYPHYGIGDIVTHLTNDIAPHNMLLNSDIVSINHNQHTIESIDINHAGQKYKLSAQQFLTTIPITRLVKLFNPAPAISVLQATQQLRGRDLIIVTLFVKKDSVTRENWIYYPEKHVPFGRIHEPKNWSKHMAPPGYTSLVNEIFCFHTDPIWQLHTKSLVALTINSLVDFNLIRKTDVVDATVNKIRYAYPLFEVGYRANCEAICHYLDGFTNLSLAGRNGMFRYYNLDQAMLSGIEAVSPLLVGNETHADWLLNEYLLSQREINNEVRAHHPSLAT